MALTLGPEIKDNYGWQIFRGRSDSLVTQQWTLFFGIFSGTAPTTPEQFYSTQGTWPYSSGACLMYWQSSVTSTYVTITDNELKLTENFFSGKTPQRSGTAAWFAIWRANNSVKYNAVVGDIGIIGSGAELEMADPVINTTTGIAYTFPSELRLVVPYPL